MNTIASPHYIEEQLVLQAVLDDQITRFSSAAQQYLSVGMMSVVMGLSSRFTSAMKDAMARENSGLVDWDVVFSPFRQIVSVRRSKLPEVSKRLDLSDQERIKYLRLLDSVDEVDACQVDNDEAHQIAELYHVIFRLTKNSFIEMARGLATEIALAVERSDPKELRETLTKLGELQAKLREKRADCESLISATKWLVQKADTTAQETIKETTDDALRAFDAVYCKSVNKCFDDVSEAYLQVEDKDLRPEHSGFSSWEEAGLGS
ncbi:MAG: hypothetical protein HQL53_00615 [Magnetococcales bacterium]|nr:hypothetical protein [Magnetococcales bacterium]